MANNRRRLVGRVVSDKMDKTVVVSIERRRAHRVYKKVITERKRVMAHDESNAIPVGALVQLVESRPLSKRKRWVVETIIDETVDALTGSLGAQEEVATMLGVDEAPVETEAAVESPGGEADAAAEDDEAEAEAGGDEGETEK